MKKLIILPFQNPKFYIRKKGDQIHPPHPNTAIKIENELYEIVEHYVKEGKHFYVLEPWDDLFIIRFIMDWNKEEEKKFIEEAKREKTKEKKEKIVWYFQIFLGFLPANYQEKLEEKIGLNPISATFWSSLFEFLFSFLVLVLNLISQFAKIYGAFIKFTPKWYVLICFFTLIEGILRLIYNISSSEPVGSFIFSFLNLRLKGRKAKLQEDNFKLTEYGLIVETPYEKLHWEKLGGINFEEQNYILNEKIKKDIFFIYNFLKTEKGFPKIYIEEEKKYNSRSDSSIIFAPFWGFLEKGFQEEIEKYGRYDSKKFTKISIFFNLLFSTAFIISRTLNILFSKFFILDFFILIIAIFLFSESIKRLINFYNKEEITGSFLSFFIKPFYHILFR